MEQFTPEMLGNNPLVGNLAIPASWKRAKKHFVRDEEGSLTHECYRVERTHYVKLYLTPEIRDLLISLPPPAYRLMIYIMERLDHEKDYVQVNSEHFLRIAGTKSVNTLTAGKKELMRRNIIAITTVRSVIWINPAIFFHGNRMDVYTNKVTFPYGNEIL